ncbi:conserved Plasmodium protein, unknown function [Plasmodium berghei]|uniref:Uncharacterized protein n=2 Tax=Plasmodium berghei TaxID=5821 RepID=A0A509AP36_PLABA|nr:conserved Plasmodium protein, unknown function [Plasmodium berghei ANKA]CXI35730.1 conserved Plasmodium protein, unknown function [Plasmodium berghei]SCM21532.1 conserved Plasmodium protein, unknown function [Plasmodium berghei]SCN24731.1 conserved Plasmodium protein, unknown function [Plasmodium berghei]SCO59871.1 conserved Plasmodium protein, unknown function [Plasmodium berghei]SCO61189.1 conserved Plasmodium protein, unknown function [Plasmodium berghei]|eukprot:XP_034421267.1 conserved Plasmodium protein, unknown function [Plasmodium berghei ANKA]
MFAFPYTSYEALEKQINDVIFQSRLEKTFNIYPKDLYNKLFNNSSENVKNAINIDKKILELKKSKLINKKYTFVSVSILLVCSAVYFTFKTLANKIIKFSHISAIKFI